VQYIVQDKGDYKALYQYTDTSMTKEVGRIVVKPDGKRKVELY